MNITDFGEGIDANSPVKLIRQLPHRQWDGTITGVTDVVIVPRTKRDGLHDSGYRVMEVAAGRYGRLYCLLTGCSDVIHLGGISGYNNRKWYETRNIKERTIPASWSIDCLPNNGLLRIFSHGHDLDPGCALSSFELFAVTEKSRG